MICTEEIIHAKYHCGPVGASIDRPSLRYESIEALIANLSANGVNVNPEYSQKQVKYPLSTGPSETVAHTALLPLASQLPPNSSIETIHLRDGKGLELEFRDYDHIISEPPTGRIGGFSSGDFGIICKLTLKKSKPDLSVIDAVREAIARTYVLTLED